MGRLCIRIAGISIGAGLLLSLAFGPRARARQAPQKNAETNPPRPALMPSAIPAKSISRNIRQLTFGGESAEAYFSADDKYLTFQHQGQFLRSAHAQTRRPQYSLRPDLHDARPAAGAIPPRQHRVPKMLSNGQGRTTCSYFFPSRRPHPLFLDLRRQPGLPASARLFARLRLADLRHVLDLHGQARRQRHSPAHQGRLQRRIHHHARRQAHRLHLHAQWRPRHLHHGRGRLQREAAHARTRLRRRALLVLRRQKDRLPRRASARRPSRSRTTRTSTPRGLIRPGNLELWVMNADGSGKHQVTHNGAANFAPYWLPDGKRIVFSSNMTTPKTRRGSTSTSSMRTAPAWSASPPIPASTPSRCFHPTASGWCGPRIATARVEHETNIFIADWVE